MIQRNEFKQNKVFEVTIHILYNEGLFDSSETKEQIFES